MIYSKEMLISAALCILIVMPSACTEDTCTQCKTTEICFHDKCSVPCNASNQCAQGEYCNNQGICQLGLQQNPCGDLLQCPPDSMCLEGICYRTCQEQNECYPIEYCAVNSGVCSDRLKSGENCEHDYMCLSNSCVSDQCYNSCITDNDCSTDTFCDTTIPSPACLPLLDFGSDCSRDNQCQSDYCYNNSCNIACEDQPSLCPTDFYCITDDSESHCLGKADFGEDCNSDEQCISGICLMQSTSDSFCSITCSDHGDCVTGQFCDTLNPYGLVCQPGRIPGQTCYSQRDCSNDDICTLLLDANTEIYIDCTNFGSRSSDIGDDCDAATECKSNICLYHAALGEKYCTQLCEDSMSDCDSGALQCQRHTINDLHIDICFKQVP